jgi:hypothetical protein
MPFRLFPRYRRPSMGELPGTTQIKRRVSRKYRLRAITDGGRQALATVRRT